MPGTERLFDSVGPEKQQHPWPRQIDSQGFLWYSIRVTKLPIMRYLSAPFCPQGQVALIMGPRNKRCAERSAPFFN